MGLIIVTLQVLLLQYIFRLRSNPVAIYVCVKSAIALCCDLMFALAYINAIATLMS